MGEDSSNDRASCFPDSRHTDEEFAEGWSAREIPILCLRCGYAAIFRNGDYGLGGPPRPAPATPSSSPCL
jgi:hypothetical protein